MIFKVGNWLVPFVLMAVGIYLASGHIMSLVEVGLVGVGAFILGCRVWSRIRDTFQTKTEEALKVYAKQMTPADVLPPPEASK